MVHARLRDRLLSRGTRHRRHTSDAPPRPACRLTVDPRRAANHIELFTTWIANYQVRGGPTETTAAVITRIAQECRIEDSTFAIRRTQCPVSRTHQFGDPVLLTRCATPGGRRPAAQHSTTERPRTPEAIARSENLSAVKWRFRRVSGRAGRGVTGQLVCPVVVGWVQGLGSDFAEEPVFRCEPVTQATETFLKCPARARWSADAARRASATR